MFDAAKWKEQTAQLAPGDLLILYTDGVTEAQDAEGVLFGEGRLLTASRTCLGQSAEAIGRAVLNDIHAFVSNAPQADDITLLLIRREDT
jgi:sigma-B regulation protein RsbU (phosphoserine phosphatase)